MKIFLSYPSEERQLAERLQYALLAQGHDVFFDRADLAPGHEYDSTIARELAASDLFVFFITPASVASGRYTLTELGLAERTWPSPSGRVLPVMVRPTEIDAVPAYLRAVNFLVPRGDAVAETAQEVQRMVAALPVVTRVARHVRSRGGIVALVVLAVLAASLFSPRVRGAFRGERLAADGDSSASDAVPRVSSLPADVRHRARAVASTVDGGFVVAAASPAQLIRFSPAGARVGEPLPLKGDPVSATRSATQILVITRTPDGVTVFDGNDLHLVDTAWLDPATIRRTDSVSTSMRLSGDIQSVAIRNGMLWVTTGERDGEPAVLRFLPERRWDVPTWMLKAQGFTGGDVRGLQLRRVDTELWGVSAATTPSSLYHLVGFIRIDEFDGHDLRLISCAHDLAPSSRGNLLVLSCDNELQELSVEGKQLSLLSARPTLPSESGPGNWTHEIITPAGAATVVALNTEVNQPNNQPGHARVAEIDSAGAVRTLLDMRDATVKSMAVTGRMVVAVLRRADGRFDAVMVSRVR